MMRRVPAASATKGCSIAVAEPGVDVAVDDVAVVVVAVPTWSAAARVVVVAFPGLE